MTRAFLFANPAAHSRSPAMHNAAFRVAGIEGHYEARQVLPAELAAATASLRAPGMLGANLSLPHKETVLALLDELTPAARAIGAVNTIVNQGGRLLGDNTDAPGFLAALRGAGDSGAGTAVVLGAGGAARAAVWALRSGGLGSERLGSEGLRSGTPGGPAGRPVYVVNRTFEKAVSLTRELGGVPCHAPEVPWSEVRLLVNASSVGLDAPGASALTPLPALAPGALVYDMVYKPAETRLMQDARAAGYRAENGLSMLAQQARLAFLAWTGADVPIGVFLNALEPAP